MGAAKGVVRRLPVDKNLVYDYIPVDIVVNQMITGAWHVSVNRYSLQNFTYLGLFTNSSTAKYLNRANSDFQAFFDIF